MNKIPGIIQVSNTVGEEKFGRRFLNLLDRLEWEWWIFEWKLVPLQVVF